MPGRNSGSRSEIYLFSRSEVGIATPKIYRAFETRGRTYIVMKYIDIIGYASDEERANAVAQLVSIKPPSVLYPVQSEVALKLSNVANERANLKDNPFRKIYFRTVPGVSTPEHKKA
jgi:hypothetical protein